MFLCYLISCGKPRDTLSLSPQSPHRYRYCVSSYVSSNVSIMPIPSLAPLTFAMYRSTCGAIFTTKAATLVPCPSLSRWLPPIHDFASWIDVSSYCLEVHLPLVHSSVVPVLVLDAHQSSLLLLLTRQVEDLGQARTYSPRYMSLSGQEVFQGKQ